MSFQDYLKNRQDAFATMTDSLKKEVNNESRPGDDDRIWKPKMSKDNTGYAVVRFLPGRDVNKTPWVRVYSHGFQGRRGISTTEWLRKEGMPLTHMVAGETKSRESQRARKVGIWLPPPRRVVSSIPKRDHRGQW